MEEEGGARRGRPARPVEGGRRRKAERGGAGQRRVEGGRRRRPVPSPARRMRLQRRRSGEGRRGRTGGAGGEEETVSVCECDLWMRLVRSVVNLAVAIIA